MKAISAQHEPGNLKRADVCDNLNRDVMDRSVKPVHNQEVHDDALNLKIAYYNKSE